LDDAQDQNKLLKSGRMETLKKTFGLWGTDQKDSFLRVVLSGWRKVVTDLKHEAFADMGPHLASASSSIDPRSIHLQRRISRGLPVDGVLEVNPASQLPAIAHEPRSNGHVPNHYNSLLDRFEMLLDRLSPVFSDGVETHGRQGAPPRVTPVSVPLTMMPAGHHDGASYHTAAPLTRVYPVFTASTAMSPPPAPRLLTPAIFSRVPTQGVVLNSPPVLATWPQMSGHVVTRERSPAPVFAHVGSVTRATSPQVQIRTLSPGHLPRQSGHFSPRMTSVSVPSAMQSAPSTVSSFSFRSNGLPPSGSFSSPSGSFRSNGPAPQWAAVSPTVATTAAPTSELHLPLSSLSRARMTSSSSMVQVQSPRVPSRTTSFQSSAQSMH